MQDIKEKIIRYLKTTRFGASSSELAKQIGHNRITISKYLEILNAEGKLEYEEVGQAKVWRVKEAGQKYKILIVDDEPHVINLVKLSLMSGSYELHEAASGIEALEKIKEVSPDLIVLDLMMPGMTGYEVCKQLKESVLTQHIQIIMLTAKGELDDKIKGISVHADDYMTKPFDPMELEARVNLMLRYKEHTSEKHPITKLPSKGALKNKIEKALFAGHNFTVYNFSLENFSEYVNRYGYKKGNDVLIILSRLLQNKLPEPSFVGHTIKNSFVVLSPQQNAESVILEEFEKMIPYFHDDQSASSGLNLAVSKLSTDEINRSGLAHWEILPSIKVQ